MPTSTGNPHSFYNSLELSNSDRPTTNATRNDSEEDHRATIMERKKKRKYLELRPEQPKNLRVEKIIKKWNFDILNRNYVLDEV